MLDTIINTNPPITNDEKADYAFISYSHKDKDIVYDDLWALHEKGFSFWYDDRITAGNVWNETVDKVVNSPFCKLAIFFVSENSVIILQPTNNSLIIIVTHNYFKIHKVQ